MPKLCPADSVTTGRPDDPPVLHALCRNCTPLYLASWRGHHRVVEELLAHPEVAVNQGPGGDGPLSIAAAEGHAHVVRVLLSHRRVDVGKGSPLSIASEAGHSDVVRMLELFCKYEYQRRTRDGCRRATQSSPPTAPNTIVGSILEPIRSAVEIWHQILKLMVELPQHGSE